MHSLTRPVRGTGIALALALFAAACGSGTTPIEASSKAVDTAPDASGDNSATPSTGDAAAAPTGEESTGSAAEGPAPAADNNFPDLNTVNIVDGSTINLAQELAGGDTPVLLWFWAPH